MFTVTNRGVKIDNPYFMSNDVLHAILDNTRWLLDSPNTQEIMLDYQKIRTYIGNPHGLMSSIGVPIKYWSIVLAINGIYGPQDFDETVTSIVVPDTTRIDQLYTIHNTLRGQLKT